MKEVITIAAMHAIKLRGLEGTTLTQILHAEEHGYTPEPEPARQNIIHFPVPPEPKMMHDQPRMQVQNDWIFHVAFNAPAAKLHDQQLMKIKIGEVNAFVRECTVKRYWTNPNRGQVKPSPLLLKWLQVARTEPNRVQAQDGFSICDRLGSILSKLINEKKPS